jgi:hypothetical protein
VRRTGGAGGRFWRPIGSAIFAGDALYFFRFNRAKGFGLKTRRDLQPNAVPKSIGASLADEGLLEQETAHIVADFGAASMVLYTSPPIFQKIFL